MISVLDKLATTDQTVIDYTVIHAIPGRIRLKIPQLASVAYQSQLSQHLSCITQIQSFRINPVVLSVVICYCQSTVDDWEIWLSKILKVVQADQTSEALYHSQTMTQAEPTTIPNSLVPSTLAITKKSKFTFSIDMDGWSNLTLPLISTLLAFASNYFHQVWLRWGARTTLVMAAYPVAERAINSLVMKRQLNIDCLDLIALILSGLQGKLVTPSLVITLHELGDLIREHTARATEQNNANLLDTIGHFAWVERGGEILQIISDQVLVGDRVIVHPGERIPVDGMVLTGEATVDQQQLTGESMPIVAKPDTYVYASTLVRSGQISLQCGRVASQTRAAASIELLAKAPVHDTRMANYAAKLADKLIVPSLLLAGVVYATTQDPTRAASILTLDFVTGVRVSMPTAFLGALNHTTRHGILVRSGRTMELLAEVDTVVFDKTGTLTEGDIAVVGVTVINRRLTTKRIMQLAASAEQRITHPVAEAIVSYADQQNIKILNRSDWDYVVGSGMDAEIDGGRVLVGSEKFLREKGIIFDYSCFCLESVKKIEEKDWLSFVYIAWNGQLVGIIQYTDPLRSESAILIEKLQIRYGMQVHLLTGDHQDRANQVADKLNIPKSHVHAEAFPEDKARIVRDLHRQGKVVAFVGDGLNDSVALAYADVSISFANGSDIARETADVVLMNNDLLSILEAIAIAKETANLIEQNTILVVAPNLIGLGLASSIGLNPLLATIIHNGTAIAAGLNSLRPIVQHQLEAQIRSSNT